MSERNDRSRTGRTGRRDRAVDRAAEHDAVIGRLRSALDEVATGTDTDLADDLGMTVRRPAGTVAAAGPTTIDTPTAHAEPAMAIGTAARASGHDRSGRHRAGTILGVAAACTAMIGGATWALGQRSPSPVDLAAPVPDLTLEEPPMTTILGVGEPWFTLASANLVMGAISRPERFPSDDEPLFQSWRIVGDGLDGFLFATITADRPIDRPEFGDGSTIEELAAVPEGRAWLVFPPADAEAFVAPSLWWSRADGSLWLFDEQGLYSATSSNVWIDMVLDAQQGSGVPIVLPSANATVFSVGITSTVVITQQYTGTTAGTVDLTVTDGAAAPTALAQAVTVEPVTVAGREGWKGTYGDGHVEVVWNVGGGWWGLLGISTELADQADGIIAAVAPTGDAVIPATPAAPPPDAPTDAQEFEVVGTLVEFPAGTFAIEVPTPDQSVIQLGLRDVTWEAVSIERSALDGVVRSEPGMFTVRDYRDRSAAFVSVQVPAGFAEPADPCVFDQDVLPLDGLNALDQAALDIAGYAAVLNSDGTCDRIVLFVYVDSPGLRDAIAPFADAIEVRPILTPI